MDFFDSTSEFCVIDSRLQEPYNIIHKLNNINDALDIKSYMNKIHLILIRNNLFYGSLYEGIENPYKIMVIRNDFSNLH